MELAHYVEVDASPAFAWTYLTNVANWVDPPAEFKLDGAFTAGSRGTTVMPGQKPRHWRIRSVSPLESYIIEIPLDRATLLFEWRFDALAGQRTGLTQRIVLEGENAAAYVEQVHAGFAPNLAAGMNRVATAIGQAQASGRAG